MERRAYSISIMLLASAAYGSENYFCDEPKEQEQCLARRVSDAKADVTHDFKDPDSAMWRDLYFAGKDSSDMIYPTVCGEVNGKNSYGAYVGYRRFFAAPGGGPLVMVEDKDNRRVFDGMWPTMCGNKLRDIK